MFCCEALAGHDEISIYLQRPFYDSQSCDFSLDGAGFNVPKPPDLHVSDDTWASLKLRIDPLARNIKFTHRIFFGAVCLVLVLRLFFEPFISDVDVRNDDDEYHFDDENMYYYKHIDDFWAQKGAGENERQYKNEAVENRRHISWIIFCFLSGIICLVSVIASVRMEKVNSRLDYDIKGVCEELKPRFEHEGYGIDYRTRLWVSGTVLAFLFPKRVICFYIRVIDIDIRNTENRNSLYSPPSNFATATAAHVTSGYTAGGFSNAGSYGTMNVFVPTGFKPGQVVNVMTPSGYPIMVAVPDGARPGQSFPIKIPAQMCVRKYPEPLHP